MALPLSDTVRVESAKIDPASASRPTHAPAAPTARGPTVRLAHTLPRRRLCPTASFSAWRSVPRMRGAFATRITRSPSCLQNPVRTPHKRLTHTHTHGRASRRPARAILASKSSSSRNRHGRLSGTASVGTDVLSDDNRCTTTDVSCATGVRLSDSAAISDKTCAPTSTEPPTAPDRPPGPSHARCAASRCTPTI